MVVSKEDTVSILDNVKKILLLFFCLSSSALFVRLPSSSGSAASAAWLLIVAAGSPLAFVYTVRRFFSPLFLHATPEKRPLNSLVSSFLSFSPVSSFSLDSVYSVNP